MIKNLIIASSVLFLSCGDNNPTDNIVKTISRESPIPSKNIDKSLIPYLEDFVIEAASRKISLPLLSKLTIVKYDNIIQDDPNDKKIVGRCTTYRNSSGEIKYTKVVIDSDYRERSGSYQLKALMFHEFAHCILRLGHYRTDPPSIMNPSLPSEMYYQLNWQKLVDQMFSH